MNHTVTHSRKYYTKRNCHNIHTYPDTLKQTQKILGWKKISAPGQNKHLYKKKTWNVSGKRAQNKETCY